ncbi:MAG: DNA primase DnaG [Methanophagales archaeon]|nr:DNA primase DnaG [Methanophagales archaeon]RLG30034.1 MAG: DNA primase [Methanosarcinales archaeon]
MHEIDTTKYVIHANITAEGFVEKSDVVGAIFGQTEGLLGEELDLRDLQKSSRIGRIEVNIESKSGKSSGEILIPSGLDKVETAILAASLETIDRVGPCIAHVEVTKIEDIRATKRRRITERAKQLMREAIEKGIGSEMMVDEVKQAVRMEEISNYKGLPAGPNIESSDAILIVEGRADVLNLLKYGIKNAIAVEGTNISPAITKLSKRKTVTAFFDGDRGGELILKELLQVADVDYIAIAPEGRSVEDMTYKEIAKALHNKMPVEQQEYIRVKKEQEQGQEPRIIQRKSSKEKEVEKEKSLNPFETHLQELKGTFKARLLDRGKNILKETTVRELAKELKETKEPANSVVFDGVVTQRIVDLAKEKELDYVVGIKMGDVVKMPTSLKVLTADSI